MRRPLATLGTVLVLVFAALPANARTSALDDAFRTLDRVRSNLSANSVSGVVDAAATLAGIEPAPADHAPAALPVDVPSGLARPVSDLLGALDVAAEHVRRGVRVSPAEGRTLLDRLTRVLPKLGTGDPSEAERVELEDLRRAGTRAVDQAEILSGMAAVAAAVDRALPELAAAASDLPSTDGGAGCDLADVPLALCIDGDGDHTIEGYYALVIDLGGDDVHRHAAGGGAMIPGLALDLGGNDRWEATPMLEDGDMIVAQGTGAFSVGALVDAGGHDSYVAETTEGDILMAQGASAFGGGLFADLGGDDAYRVAGLGTGDIMVTGLGGTAFGSVAFLDAGGDDRYEVAARPVLGDVEAPSIPGVTVLGFGTEAMGSTALFADQGGSDAFDVQAAIEIPDSVELDPTGTELTTMVAGSAAMGGSAALLTGDGPADWSLSASVEVPAPIATITRMSGFGTGVMGGTGLVDDAGGDDTYAVRTHSLTVDEFHMDEACRCLSRASALGGQVSLTASGASVMAGIGVQRDRGGDDTYIAEATSRAVAKLVDERETPGPPALAQAGTEDVTIYAQGMTLASTAGLLDVSGDDRYEATARTHVVADIDVSNPVIESKPFAAPGDASAHAQAMAIGLGTPQATGAPALAELRDLGGADTYLTVSESTGTTTPDGTVVQGAEIAAAQAAADVGGKATLVDAGLAAAADSFLISPDRPACQGERGVGVWVDCGPGLGHGVGVND